MNHNEAIHTAIIRLFSGDARSEEKQLVTDWIKESPENRKLYLDLKDIWLSSGVAINAGQYHLEDAIKKFRAKVNHDKKVTERKVQLIKVFKYAAVALLVLALPFSYFLGLKNRVVQDTFTTVTCALGDKTTMILPDSSLVYLNSGSKLVFNNNFKKGERQIFLEGEAYFKVTKDKENPFHIKTREIEVEVLGTEFNLKAYPDENTVSTTLIEGSVSIASSKQKTVIKPKQKLVYSSETQRMTLFQLSDTSPDTEWKDGRLVFRNESLGDLELKLERWFDVDIFLADEAVKNRKFTGTLERESILEVMSYFSLPKSIDYKIEQNKITFYTN